VVPPLDLDFLFPRPRFGGALGPEGLCYTLPSLAHLGTPAIADWQDRRHGFPRLENCSSARSAEPATGWICSKSVAESTLNFATLWFPTPHLGRGTKCRKRPRDKAQVNASKALVHPVIAIHSP